MTLQILIPDEEITEAEPGIKANIEHKGVQFQSEKAKIS